MNYRRALSLAHEAIQPRIYVEIGVRFGVSLALARCESIGIDPNFSISTTIPSPVRLFKETSDEFFRKRSVEEVMGRRLDMGFIDGMHLSEFALRDFINLEKNAYRESVILMDDVLPEKIEFADRQSVPGAWTGDIYKALIILKKYRPDLKIGVFEVSVKGLAVISQLNPEDKSLEAAYPHIEAEIKEGQYRIGTVAELKKALDTQDVELLSSHLKSLFPLQRLGS